MPLHYTLAHRIDTCSVLLLLLVDQLWEIVEELSVTLRKGTRRLSKDFDGFAASPCLYIIMNNFVKLADDHLHGKILNSLPPPVGLAGWLV